MAVNPKWGPIIEKANNDPSGRPGTTSGNVPVTDSSTFQKGTREPTAGASASIPPFLDNPSLNPLDEAFGGVPPAGPEQ